MARYNEILAGRYNRLLNKLFSMKGAAPAPQLAGDVSVNFQLFNGVENRFLESWNSFAAMGSQTGGAAQTSQIQIRNPGNSGVIAVIEKMMVGESLADSGALVLQNTASVDLGAAVGARCLDNRPTGGPASTQTLGAACRVSEQNAFAVSGGVLFNLILQPNVLVDLILTHDQEIPLLPGDLIVFSTTTVQVNARCGFRWRERILEDSEKT